MPSRTSSRDPASIAAWWRRWPAWAPYCAAAWSLLYAAAAVYWSAGGSGFPFGRTRDSGAGLSVLADATPAGTAPVIAAVCGVAAFAAFLMAQGRGRGATRAALLAFAWTLSVTLTVVIPDYRVLVVVAYAPILLVGAPFGWPGDVRLSDALPWPVVNQAVCMAGGVLWAAATIAYQRRTRQACGHCGRPDADVAWTSPDGAARWGRWPVYLSVLVPVIYATTRWLWAAGVPLGITDAFLQEGQQVGLWWRGAALGTLAAAGGLLTFGLIRPWGEVFPRWLPLIGGRSVPPALAMLPAALVAVLVTTAGMMFVRKAITGDFRIGSHPITLHENVGALLPELLWPLWGAALAAAALAYYYRRRGRCRFCGRG